METKSYLELLFNDSSNAVYFAEVDTHDIAFMNKLMVKKLGTYDDVVGKKCYQVLHGKDSPCSFCPMHLLKESEFLEQRIFNEVTKSYHRANSTVMTVNDTKLCACKYFVAFIPEKQPAIPVMTYEKSLEDCIAILNNTKIENAMTDFMSILGEFYGAERTALYEFDTELNAMLRTFYWDTDEKGESTLAVSELATVLQFLDWLNTLKDGVGEITTDSPYKPDTIEQKLLEVYKVKNLIAYPIKNTIGKVTGFLSVSDRKEKTFDPRLIRSVARFIEDSSNKQVMLNELKAVNYMDAQTGFYNRQCYMEFIRDLSENLPLSLAVVFIHLTDLRMVNERLGFAEGNLRIKIAADFLRGYFTESFYRITGDEFICFIMDCSEGDLFDRVNKLEEDLRQEGAPVMQVGCAWDDGKINIQNLVAEADSNVLFRH